MAKNEVSESYLPPRWVLALIGVTLGFWLLLALKEIVVLLVIGYAIAYTLDPLLDYLEHKKISRPLGIAIVTVVFIAIVLLLFFTAFPTLLEEYRHLVSNLGEYSVTAKQRFLTITETFRKYLPAGMIADFDLNSAPTLSGETVKQIMSGLMAFLLQGYSITLTIVNLTLVPFVVFYLAVDIDHFHRWVMTLFPRTSRKRVEKLFHEMDEYISEFMKGQIIVCSLLFLLYACGFWLAGLKLWFLIAVIAGFGNIVPYVGTIIGVVLSSLMSLVTFGTLNHLFIIWGVFVVVQFFEATIITPKIVGDKVGISPLVVILAIVAGGKLFGLLGVFLAVPGAAVLKVISSHLHHQFIRSVES